MADTQPFEKIALAGVGLLGGSIALAARRAGFEGEIVGLGRRRESLNAALETGAIDRAELEVESAVADADLVVLATPVWTFRDLFEKLAEPLERQAVVTDVGSTKQQVVDWADELLPGPERFVGSHPIAGSDRRGPQYARADLFDGACCVLTPTGSTDRAVLERVEGFWQSLGMWTVQMPPASHDRALARVSHLPHAAAAVLMRLTDEATQDLAGPGFVDVTRIAGGDPAMWRDIFRTNRDAMLAALDELDAGLAEFRKLLEADDADALRDWLADAQSARHAMIDRKRERGFFDSRT
jgi:prephenate dehydrogenase